MSTTIETKLPKVNLIWLGQRTLQLMSSDLPNMIPYLSFMCVRSNTLNRWTVVNLGEFVSGKWIQSLQ